MSYAKVGLTTWCLDTEQNWREFERFKESLRHGGYGAVVREMLQRRIGEENKRLRDLSEYLPGEEPDR
jgi:hypothetical protein